MTDMHFNNGWARSVSPLDQRFGAGPVPDGGGGNPLGEATVGQLEAMTERPSMPAEEASVRN